MNNYAALESRVRKLEKLLLEEASAEVVKFVENYINKFDKEGKGKLLKSFKTTANKGKSPESKKYMKIAKDAVTDFIDASLKRVFQKWDGEYDDDEATWVYTNDKLALLFEVDAEKDYNPDEPVILTMTLYKKEKPLKTAKAASFNDASKMPIYDWMIATCSELNDDMKSKIKTMMSSAKA